MTEPFPFTQPNGSEAEVFIQWKGTKVCMDFRCPCGADCHLDESFAYFVRCPHCDSVFELGTAVIVRRNEGGRDRAKTLDPDEDRPVRASSERLEEVAAKIIEQRKTLLERFAR